MSLGGTKHPRKARFWNCHDPDRSAGPLLAGKAEKAPAAAAEAGEHGGGHGGEAPSRCCSAWMRSPTTSRPDVASGRLTRAAAFTFFRVR